ncbi:nicotinamide N-methyltransferase-like isoform X2 [Oscarella lobularis]
MTTTRTKVQYESGELPQRLSYGEDYIRDFDANAYVKKNYFNEPPVDNVVEPFVLKNLHDFYTKTAEFSLDSASILEFGGGAAVSHLISATPYASNIVFADYSPSALNAVDEWKKAPFTREHQNDWRDFFRYVVCDLERNADDDGDELIRRASQLKGKLSSLVPCNILSDTPLGNNDYDQRFDVVSSAFCLEVASRTYEQYKLSVKKLVNFLKGSGSWLVLHCFLGAIGYCVGEKTFFALPLKEDVVKEALDEAGFRLVKFDYEPEKANCQALCHAVGQLK